MKATRLKYVHEFRDRHGTVRRYFRKPGCKQVALNGEPGSAEFLEAYARCLSGSQPIAVGSNRTKPRSIAALIVEYRKTAEYLGLEQVTKDTYNRTLERIRENWGTLPVISLERKHLKKIQTDLAGKPNSANFFIRMFRMILNHAVEAEWRKDNPALEIKKIKIKSEGWHTWTEEEIAQFERFWPIGTRERTAFDLLLYTAQRSRDVRLMGRQHVSGEFIRVKPNKTKNTTKKTLQIKIHPELRKSLATVPTDQMLFIPTCNGGTFTPESFHNFMTKAVRKAGLPAGVPPHGLRKAAARRLAEANCSASMIAAVTGHATLAEVERYTRAADQKRLASAAVDAQVLAFSSVAEPEPDTD